MFLSRVTGNIIQGPQRWTSIPLIAEGGQQELTNCKPLKHIISSYETDKSGKDVHGNLWRFCKCVAIYANSVVWKNLESFYSELPVALAHRWYASQASYSIWIQTSQKNDEQSQHWTKCQSHQTSVQNTRTKKHDDVHIPPYHKIPTCGYSAGSFTSQSFFLFTSH